MGKAVETAHSAQQGAVTGLKAGVNESSASNPGLVKRYRRCPDWVRLFQLPPSLFRKSCLLINIGNKLGTAVLSLTPAFRLVLTEAAREKPF